MDQQWEGFSNCWNRALGYATVDIRWWLLITVHEDMIFSCGGFVVIAKPFSTYTCTLVVIPLQFRCQGSQNKREMVDHQKEEKKRSSLHNIDVNTT